ncbi:NUDIX hydrolase [Actinomadura flavalba]|uniref:NUDIX hydrolase n=1 Tax=Actinomadura flavalba TaxID=1120938 RepID=UPI0003637817|nr:NUDIX hydrolase [Actinomadura flavalba]
MADGDGDGWARCVQGHTHWGRYGASGLLLFHRDAAGIVRVLLQQRAWWGIGGGTWGMFGGARHSHEDPVAGALRETAEESTLDTALVRVHGASVEDHGGWAYTSVIASVAERPVVRAASRETRRAAWVRAERVRDRRLFPPFARGWTSLEVALSRIVLVVDAANVVGARADGWWKDRAGANARLRDDLRTLASGGVRLPEGAAPYPLAYPEIVLVVEGAARGVAAEPSPDVTVVAAPGSGDDHIVALVTDPDPDVRYLVVTADRELRARCEAAGASVLGPRWLLDRLPARRR